MPRPQAISSTKRSLPALGFLAWKASSSVRLRTRLSVDSRIFPWITTTAGPTLQLGHAEKCVSLFGARGDPHQLGADHIALRVVGDSTHDQPRSTWAAAAHTRHGAPIRCPTNGCSTIALHQDCAASRLHTARQFRAVGHDTPSALPRGGAAPNLQKPA